MFIQCATEGPLNTAPLLFALGTIREVGLNRRELAGVGLARTVDTSQSDAKRSGLSI
jgi:hypothetical protein